MSAMYPHTVTLWCRTGGGRVETWTRAVLVGVRYAEDTGAQRSPGGDRSTSAAALIVPAQAMGDYIVPGRFDGSGWTLRPRDVVAVGDVPGSEPPATARALSMVKAVRIGSAIHHLEAS